MNSTFLDTMAWKKGVGLLPQTLFQKKFQEEKFILLNGKVGNFCVDYGSADEKTCRSYAWSSNVLHYLTIEEEKINVFRWDRSFHREVYKVNQVLEKLPAFNEYLSKQRPQNHHDSIQLVLNLFRSIRGALRDRKGEDSLNALLCFLACVEEKKSAPNQLNEVKWGISKHSIEIASSINGSVWTRMLEELNSGPMGLNISPVVELMLRHASGRIFQDAHYESVFPSQLQFPELFVQEAVQTKYTSNSFSSHYTPTSIVRSIVELVLNSYSLLQQEEIVILDPAVGSGEFLKEALRQLVQKNYKGKIKLIGWDISPAAIELARFSTSFEKQACSSPSKITIEIIKADALESLDLWDQHFDVILMNPPFISWELMGKVEQELVKNILGDLYKGRPNMAGAFFLRAIEALKPNGRLGCVLPAAILESGSFEGLRKIASTKVNIDFIAKLGSLEVFEEAMASSSILIANKELGSKKTKVMWSDNSKNGYADGLRELRRIPLDLIPQRSYNNFSFYEVENLNPSDWTPIEFNAHQLLNSKLKDMTKVGELFDIKQGVRTGLNKAFLISQEFYSSLPSDERKYFKPAVTNDSIRFGNLQAVSYIFYAEGDFSLKSENDLKNKLPKFYGLHFKQFVQALSSRARKSASNYWRLSEHRSWQLDFKPKIVSKEFGNSGAFAFDVKGQFVAERSNAWLPKQTKNWKNLGYAYVAILAMPIVDILLAGLSKQIQSGAYYLSSKYLNTMPIPDLFREDHIQPEILSELIRLGKYLSEHGTLPVEDKELLETLSRLLFVG